MVQKSKTKRTATGFHDLFSIPWENGSRGSGLKGRKRYRIRREETYGEMMVRQAN